MAKILIVEDDKNLSAIYGDRLLAEGHEIVTSHDGEEALAVAVKENPDLIISDVMMPKISGFDMLDILRSTPETQNTKVIMMTALSQAEDKERASTLGANKYLVKSQVTLDDVARVVQEVLASDSTPVAPAAPDTSVALSMMPVTDTAAAGVAAATMPAPAVEPVPAAASGMAAPSVMPTPAAEPVAAAPAPDPAVAVEPAQVSIPPVEPVVADAPAPAVEPAVSTDPTPAAPSSGQKVIEPLQDQMNKPDIHALYEKEMAAEAAQAAVPTPDAGTVVEATPAPAPEASQEPPKPGDPGAIAL